MLLSGGIDSCACVAFYLEQALSVRGFFVDYRQAAAGPEERAARAVAKHFKIGLETLCCSGFQGRCEGVIPGRNAFLLTTAMMALGDDAGVLALGIHAGTRYFDCSPTFLRLMQALFDADTGGRVQIDAPFLSWSKLDIWAFAKARRLPMEITYGCERGREPPCGDCASCRELGALHARP